MEDRDKTKNPPTIGLIFPSASLLQEKEDCQYFNNLPVTIWGKKYCLFLAFLRMVNKQHRIQIISTKSPH